MCEREREIRSLSEGKGEVEAQLSREPAEGLIPGLPGIMILGEG